jgi:hypothetical protein
MALQKDVTSRHGVRAALSYSRIVDVVYNRELSADNVTVRFKTWQTAADRNNGKDPLEMQTFTFTFDEGARASNLMTQAYNAFKLQSNIGGRDWTSGTTDV